MFEEAIKQRAQISLSLQLSPPFPLPDSSPPSILLPIVSVVGQLQLAGSQPQLVKPQSSPTVLPGGVHTVRILFLPDDP